MAMDYPVGTYTIGSIALIVPLLVLGWFLARGNIRAIAAERVAEEERSGSHP
jgi:L-asparagine permease